MKRIIYVVLICVVLLVIFTEPGNEVAMNLFSRAHEYITLRLRGIFENALQ